MIISAINIWRKHGGTLNDGSGKYLNWYIKRLSNANKKVDACISGAAIEGTVKAKPVFELTV